MQLEKGSNLKKNQMGRPSILSNLGQIKSFGFMLSNDAVGSTDAFFMHFGPRYKLYLVNYCNLKKGSKIEKTSRGKSRHFVKFGQNFEF